MSHQPPHQHPSSPAASADPAPTDHRHVSDADVADALIHAVRNCTPGDTHACDVLRAAMTDYVDAARARGETHEQTVSAVRHMVATLVVSPAWSGLHRVEARDIIRSLVAFASVHYYAESSYRDAQPSTAFHFELRQDGARPAPPTRRGWDDEG